MVDVRTDADKLIEFYEAYGFEFVGNDEETGLSQLIYVMQ